MAENSFNSDNEDLDLSQEFYYRERDRNNALRALFDDKDNEASMEFTYPIRKEPDNKLEEGLIPVFEDKYEEIVSGYDAQRDIEGKDLVKEFLQSETYDSAINSLDKFEEWAGQKAEELVGTNSLIVQGNKFDNERYRDGITGYSVRMLINDKQKLMS